MYARIATEQGLIWRGHPEDPNSQGSTSSSGSFFYRVTHTYNCPLAMTDGTVETIKRHGDQSVKDRAPPTFRELPGSPGRRDNG